MDSLLEAIEKTEEHQFCVEMMKRLEIQRKNEHFCDVILEVGSGDDQARVKAHRNVLCAASPFFYNALKSDMKEKKEGVIRLQETSKAVMEEVLEYLYTGHVDINEHNAINLLEIAEFLIVPSLKELSSKFVAQTLSSSNCIEVYYTAERYQCPELKQRARDYTFSNFMDVTQSDGFLNLSVTQLEEWISSDDVTVKAEDEVFQVIVKWMDRSESRKHQSFTELFRHVRLVYVSRNYILNVILPHPLVKDSPTCTQFVLDSMKELSFGTAECYFANPPRRCLKTHEDAIVACGKGNKRTFCYVPSEEKWYKMADMPKTLSRRETSGTGISACRGKLYVPGVNDADDGTLEQYDPSANYWAPVASFTGASYPAVVSFQGSLYVIGGTNKYDVDSDCVHKYNPDTNLWQEVAPLHLARFGVCAVADKNSLYAIGGNIDGTVFVDVVERFDPERNSWSRIASILEKKMCACGAVVRDKVFVFGGYPRTAANHVEMYDPATNIWTNIECTTGHAPNVYYSAVSFKGNVFVIGSWGENDSLLVYDVDTNEWESCSNLPLDHYMNTIMVSSIFPLRIPRDILDNCEVVPQE